MKKNPDPKEIQGLCQEFFAKMGLEQEVEVGRLQDKTLPVNLRVEEPRLLIGQNGQTLQEIQHLLKAILRRHNPAAEFYLDLDINDYKKKKAEYLRELAQSTADQVALLKREKELRPMPPYERRIIHLALADRQDVATESLGEEPERRVIIKPSP